MAATTSATRLVPSLHLIVVVLLLALLTTPPIATEASSFVFYTNRCAGNFARLEVCGCNSVPTNTHGGYRFTYSGQTAAAYDAPGCTGVASTRFGGPSTGQCSPVGWQSVFIQC